MMFGIGIGSGPRALYGIWSELRQLRRLAESYFRAHEIPLPQTSFGRLKERLGKLASAVGVGTESDVGSDADVDIAPPTEDQLIEQRLREIAEDVAFGRDPGTDYRPWS